MNNDNVNYDSVEMVNLFAEIFAQGGADKKTISKSIERIGNWVGGTVSVSDEYLIFKMNKLNALFQNDTGEVKIKRSSISEVKKGKLMFFFTTADIIADGILFRFRLLGKDNDNLIKYLKQ
jgi:hypothetical protein